MTTTELLLSAWAPGLIVPALSVAVLVAYGVAFRGRHDRRAALFGLSVALFFVALASPIGVLARGYLFSAHMLQHLLLMLAVPPLLLLGLPPSPRESAPHATPERDTTTTTMVGSWLAGVGAMWIWHARPLCNAAAVVPVVQALQTASLVAMGLAFWRPVLAPRPSDRLHPFVGMLYLFSACVACTILGVIVTLSPVEVCSAYMHPTDALGIVPLLRDGWGMTCKVDQQVGGLLMWVPPCLVYGSAILATLGRYYADSSPSAPLLASKEGERESAMLTSRRRAMSDEPVKTEPEAEGSRFSADWGVPKPEAIPRPTYHPAAMAVGLTLFFWGFVTSPVVLAAGLVVIGVSLAGWIEEMRHDE